MNSRRLSQIDEGINQVRTNSPILVTTNGMLLLTPWPTSLLILTPLTQPIINMFWHISLIEQVTQLPLTQFAQVLDPQKLYTQLTRKFHHSSRLAVEYGRTGSSEQSYLATTSLMSVSQYSASICTHIWPTFDLHNHLLSFPPQTIFPKLVHYTQCSSSDQHNNLYFIPNEGHSPMGQPHYVRV